MALETSGKSNVADGAQGSISSINCVFKRLGEKALKKTVAIPKTIDDYNHHMGGVDIANQRRSYYNTQIISHRTWMTIFFWLLDTAIINSYLIAGSKEEHIDFRLN